MFGWKKYRPDRPGKDDRPYLPLCLRFDYRDTPPLGPGAKPLVGVGQSPQNVNTFWLLEERFLYKSGKKLNNVKII